MSRLFQAVWPWWTMRAAPSIASARIIMPIRNISPLIPAAAAGGALYSLLSPP
jgi:hypothetical protein